MNQPTRFDKIRKNYLTLVAISNRIKAETDQKKAMKLKRKAQQIQFNCHLLSELATDLNENEKLMLENIKNKNLT